MSNHRNIPYVPPPTRRASVCMKYCYERPIAYAVQMRGDLDDLPTIIYYGAPWQLLLDVMKYVSRCMGDALRVTLSSKSIPAGGRTARRIGEYQ